MILRNTEGGYNDRAYRLETEDTGRDDGSAETKGGQFQTRNHKQKPTHGTWKYAQNDQ